MMTFLANPQTQQQGDAVRDMPVLVSFASWSPWMERYHQSWGPMLVDSGAYSEMTGAAQVDLGAYREFVERWGQRAIATAGLDDICGDWRRSMRNYQAIPSTFPTYHDTDPPELLPELVAMAQERDTWLGVGLLPPRNGKRAWLERTMRQVPRGLHVHGWALRAYRKTVNGFASMDSTNWFRDAMAIRSRAALQHLTYGECLDIIVKRYKRELLMTPSRVEQIGLAL